MATVVTFGELMIRLQPYNYERFVQADRLAFTFGGGEANVAVSLANYGVDTAFVTKLPAHAIGQCAVNSLRRYGVDTSRIVRGGSRVGIYFISDRPEIAAQRMEEGRWEGGTVAGKRTGHEAVVLTLLEKKTENYLAIRIPGKTSKAVMDAMATLRAGYVQHFPQVFKTITADNGSEFAGFAQTEAWGSKVFFAHP